MQLKNSIAPLVISVFGLGILIFGLTNDQTGLFNLGAAAILIAGIIATLSSMDIFNKGTRMGILGLLIVVAVALTWFDYKVIKDPLDFQQEKERRYTYVIQNLKDLREVQMNYKEKYGKFAGSMDTLMNFIKNDSVLIISSRGTVPDTLTETQALEQGIIVRDTSKVPAQLSIFNDKYLLDRKVPLIIDSLPYVPFSTMAFEVQAGNVERGRVKVPVFLIVDTAPFDINDVLQVGSMTEPSTAGNWGE